MRGREGLFTISVKYDDKHNDLTYSFGTIVYESGLYDQQCIGRKRKKRVYQTESNQEDERVIKEKISHGISQIKRHNRQKIRWSIQVPSGSKNWR